MEFDVVSVGEILIDLTQTGCRDGVPQYAANPGGAPANAAVAAARMGCKTAFVGRVGADAFGCQLRETLEREGIDLSGLSVDPVTPTTLAVVSVAQGGERSFRFYRDPGADTRLSRADIPNPLLGGCKLLHFGSLSLTDEPARSAVLDAVAWAKARGAYISYDPNYRAPLWPDEATARRWMRRGLELADLVKLSEEEAELLTGSSDPAQAAQALTEAGAQLALVTMGPRGVCYRFPNGAGTVAGIEVAAVDTNGAGDTFLGAALSGLIRAGKPLCRLSREELEGILRFSNRAAALAVSRPGAIPAIPTRREVEAALAGDQLSR